MCLTDQDLDQDLDLDLDLDLPEIADDEEQARPEPHPVDGQYAGVAWGRAERGLTGPT
jgi:hypothetical protein